MMRTSLCLLVLFSQIVLADCVPFRQQGRALAITSAARSCPGKRLRVDWGRDLALYETAADPATLPELTPVSPRGRVVTLAGRTGRLLTTKSRRHAIALVPEAYELQGVTIGAESVGAAVRDTEGNFLGIVSHQYLQLLPGSASRPVEWDDVPGHRESHLVIIPATEIASWLANATEPAFYRVSAHTIAAGGLRFTLLCPPAEAPGGGGPIGGSDGVGIGGGSAEAPYCKTVLSAGPDGGPRWPFAKSEAWADALRARLVNHETIEIGFFVQGDIERAAFRNLGELARLLAEGVATPVLRGPAVDAELAAVGVRWQALARRWYADAPNTPELRGFERRMYLFAELLVSENPRLLGARSLRGLFDPHGIFSWPWLELKQWYPAETARVLAELPAVAAKLP